MLRLNFFPNHQKLCQNFVRKFPGMNVFKVAFVILTGHSSLKVGRVHGAIPVSKIVGIQPSSLYNLIELMTVCQNLGELCSK